MQANEPLARAEALVGQEVGAGLELVRVLAVGDLMSVFAAKSPTRGLLAVKLLHPALARTIAGDLPSVLRIANDLAHPRAPTVAEEIAVSDTLGVVTQLVDGESLRELLTRRRVLPPAEALRIAADLLTVLDAAHARGLVHGALTPSHVLLTREGQVRVIGFGERRLRRPIERDLWAGWLAPEARERTAIDAPIADLWAVAALAFAMMTGQSPYGPPAASRERIGGTAALPLEQVAARAPAELCRVLNRALARLPSQRWPDAGSLRAALLDASSLSDVVLAARVTGQWPQQSAVASPVLDAVREMRRSSAPPKPTPESTPAREPTPVPPREPTPVPPREPTPVPPREPTPVPEAETRAKPLSVPPARPPSGEAALELDVTSDERGSQALATLFTALDSAVAARLDPSSGDPAEAFERLCATAIQTTLPAALTCRVRSDELVTDARSVWSRPGALTDAVGTLYRAGVEALSLLPGVTPEDLERWVEVGVRAAGGRASPAEVLEQIFSADFSHVLFHVSDPFASIAGSARTRLENERRRLLALFTFDSSFQLEDAWASAQSRTSRSSQSQPELIQDAGPLEARPSDPALAGVFATDDEGDGERLMLLAATAMDGSAFEPALEAFAPALRRRLERMAAHAPERALDFALRLARSVRAPRDSLLARQRVLAAAVISPAVSVALFRGLATGQPKAALVEQLSEVLPLLGADHAVPLARALPFVEDPMLQAKIEHHLQIDTTGHEQALGDLARSEDARVAAAVLRVLSHVDTPAARRALERIAESPHLGVRIEALGMRDGAAGEKLRRELKHLLEDAPENERIANLRALIDGDVRIAGPAIALRLKSPSLDSLSFEERRLLFNAICQLAPSRAEALTREILSNRKLLSSSSHEETRAMAATALGRIAASEETVELLEELARKRWGTNETVRSAAERALEEIERRGGNGR